MFKRKPAFLDGASNTPIDRAVVRAMKPYLRPRFVGNSMSTHDYGIKANKVVVAARQTIADVLGVKPSEVYFTSGATEGNNWVILSTALAQIRKKTGRNRIVCSSTEHSSVVNSCKSLEGIGFEVVMIPPNQNGRITLAKAKPLITETTALVCVMAVNNETGLANEADEIAKYAKQKGALNLIDCTQALGFGGSEMKLAARYPHGDYMTFSGHKIYGPTGIGCLIARDDVPLDPILYGGAQERGKRGGTHNVAGIVGLAKAVQLMAKHDYLWHFTELFSYVLTKADQISPKKWRTLFVPKYDINKDHIGIISLRLQFDGPGYASDLLSTMGIAASSGSACDAANGIFDDPQPSHVLTAMGFDAEEARHIVRISFTKYTTKRDIDRLFRAIKQIEGDQVNAETKEN